MAIRTLPPQSRLLQLFTYEPSTGRLYWNPRPASDFGNKQSWKAWNTKYSNKRAGYRDGKGYRMVRIDAVGYFEHRIIIAIHTGQCTATDVDHINGDGEFNKFENLREVTHSNNARNMKRPTDNKSGKIGVHWSPRKRKWIAMIGSKKTLERLGAFSNLADAVSARAQAEVRHGYHPNHGRY